MPTLLILAAGSSSRFGSSKQTASIGDHGETIMDYSMYDAVRAGFTKIVFVIREPFFEVFKASIEAKWAGIVELAYVFQESDSFVSKKGISREKPWGTGHALLCAKEEIKSPFCVINADDFYGFHSYQLIYDFLIDPNRREESALVGYAIESTLSENGGVSRGVCHFKDDYLESIEERLGIEFVPLKNKIIAITEKEEIEIFPSTIVSMNFWGFNPSIFPIVQTLFDSFIEKHQGGNEEFYLPFIIQSMIQENDHKVKIIKSKEQWFGITFPADHSIVRNKIHQLIINGIYPNRPWEIALKK